MPRPRSPHRQQVLWRHQCWRPKRTSSSIWTVGSRPTSRVWKFGCINCKRTLPYLQEIYADHGGAGLEIVGVHSPEFTFEEDPVAVAAAAEELGVTWPIALDTRQRNFFGWQGSRGYWPRTYVIDQAGQVRFDHIGEGKYEELAATVHYLLTESA
jgi:thiol-disulfide isomerase/thioredoxin